MSPFWAELPVQVDDAIGREQAHIERNRPDVHESHRLRLRGSTFFFDDVDELFAKYLADSSRLTWSLVVDVTSRRLPMARVACVLRVDGRKALPRDAITGTSPVPSFYVRAAITLPELSLTSRWHIDWSGGFEEALADLRGILDEDQAIESCFFCRWSDYEPSSSTGHLGCFRAVKKQYDMSATADDGWTRKYAKESFGAHRVWVDELNVCEEFEKRPPGYGYRG